MSWYNRRVQYAQYIVTVFHRVTFVILGAQIRFLSSGEFPDARILLVDDLLVVIHRQRERLDRLVIKRSQYVQSVRHRNAIFRALRISPEHELVHLVICQQKSRIFTKYKITTTANGEQL